MTEFDKVIPPGREGKVSAVINTATFKGPVSKSVTVTTNDPANARFMLTLKGTILVPLDLQPSENATFNGKAGTLPKNELTITSTDKSVFDILSVTPSDPAFATTVVAAPETGTAPRPKAGTVASGANRYRITITPAATVAVGRINANVTLKTSHPKAPEQVIRIFGTVTGDVEVIPQNVTLGTGPAALPESKIQHVVIRKPSGDPLQILQVTADNPQIATTLKTITEGREYDLEVKYTGQPLTAAMSSKVRIRTNDARQASLEIPVWGRVDQPARPGQAAPPPVPVRPVPVTPSKAPPSP